MANEFGLEKPGALVGSDVQGVYAVNAFPIVPVAGQPIPVSESGTWTVGVSGITAGVPDITINGGTVNALNANINTGVMNGVATVVVLITGTWVATISFFGSIDSGAHTLAMNAYTSGTAAAVTTTAANGTWVIPCAGFQTVYAVVTAYTSGTAAINMRGSTAHFPLR